ncbi:LrgB family protein [Thiomicrorhabdus sp. ZW0627]|uniref:LrgB family protein n=1 Tax=Thiomicrorhabdus sp. ZW0627 TaxID=3039774 RepID=UPI002436FF50|nr:LrgB family protein [Thiomicrorhabdus sp. ZW0627]MDG6774659.1 LrgB family protein [Thiomicrorhabdus sp. ZW0627]
MKDYYEIWVYLSASPLFGLTLTLVCYLIALKIYRKGGGNPLLTPVATSIVMIILVLTLMDIPYYSYFSGAQFIHFLLGPATVALAIPLFFQLKKLKTVWLPMSVALICGITVAGFSAYFIAQALGASHETILSLIPKSVTAPVAMGISEQIGGLPTLTAVFVVITGVLGAIMGVWLFKIFKITDDDIKGVAMGVTAHGLGTATSLQINQQMGAFAGLAMALSASVSAFILPFVLSLVSP